MADSIYFIMKNLHKAANTGAPVYVAPDAVAALEAALVQPAPPAEGEVAELVAWLRLTADEQPHTSGQGGIRLARAANLLTRLALQPIPVSERLPGPGDCDAEGRVWWWYPPVPEQTYGYWAHEDDAIPDRAIDEQPTHWLPATALPAPTHTSEKD